MSWQLCIFVTQLPRVLWILVLKFYTRKFRQHTSHIEVLILLFWILDFSYKADLICTIWSSLLLSPVLPDRWLDGSIFLLSVRNADLHRSSTFLRVPCHPQDSLLNPKRLLSQVFVLLEDWAFVVFLQSRVSLHSKASSEFANKPQRVHENQQAIETQQNHVDLESGSFKADWSHIECKTDGQNQIGEI